MQRLANSNHHQWDVWCLLEEIFREQLVSRGAFVHPLGKAQAHQGSVVLGQGQIPAAFFGDPVCVGVQKLVEPLLRKGPGGKGCTLYCREQLGQHNSESPDVDLFVGSLAAGGTLQPLLWRAVCLGPERPLWGKLIWKAEVPGDAKVCQLNFIPAGQENVCRLHIPVHYLAVVKVGQGPGKANAHVGNGWPAFLVRGLVHLPV